MWIICFSISSTSGGQPTTAVFIQVLCRGYILLAMNQEYGKMASLTNHPIPVCGRAGRCFTTRIVLSRVLVLHLCSFSASFLYWIAQAGAGTIHTKSLFSPLSFSFCEAQTRILWHVSCLTCSSTFLSFFLPTANRFLVQRWLIIVDNNISFSKSGSCD